MLHLCKSAPSRPVSRYETGAHGLLVSVQSSFHLLCTSLQLDIISMICEQYGTEEGSAQETKSMSVSKQPKNRQLQKQEHTPQPGSQGYGDRGDPLGVSLSRMLELGVTFTHTTGTAGRTQGTHKKQARGSGFVKPPREIIMRRQEHRGANMLPLRLRLAEGWGSKQIRLLGDEACSYSSVSVSAFVRNLKI